jgi:hypothetical protein
MRSVSQSVFIESLCLEREVVLSLFGTGLRASLPAILLTWSIRQDDFSEFNQQQTSWGETR